MLTPVSLVGALALLVAGDNAPSENRVAQGIPPLPDTIAATGQPYGVSCSRRPESRRRPSGT